MKALVLRLLLLLVFPFLAVVIACMDWRSSPVRSLAEFSREWADVFRKGTL